MLSPPVARELVEMISQPECQPDDVGEILTDREREVLILVAEGYTNRRIADLLWGDGHRTTDLNKVGCTEEVRSGR